MESSRLPAPLVASVSDLWGFVEAVARPCSSDDIDARLTLFNTLQTRAQELLTARCNYSTTADGSSSSSGDVNNAASGAGSDSIDPLYAAASANDRVARRVLERRSSSRGEDSTDDKSDTLSDCTTITETSSVYGVQNTWVDLAVLYSLPFVIGDGCRLKALPPINIAQEQAQLHKIFHECQRAIHTMRAVATVDSLRKVLDRGVTVLHFSGHGGRIAGRTNCLVFEDTQRSGLAHLIDAATLRAIMQGGADVAIDSTTTGMLSRTNSLDVDTDSTSNLPLSRNGLSGTLKLVFVSSCHSRDVGEIFIEAGVQHVVCVRSGDKILDEAASMFAYAFYHATLAGKTIHQAFDIARVRVRADMQIPDTESDKFLLLESSHVHADSCPFFSEPDAVPVAIEVQFPVTECTCNAAAVHLVFTDLSPGKWVDVSPTNRFSKTLPAVPESFVGREQELHMLAGLVLAQRFVTMRGPPGIGKSTLSVKLAHFVAERNVFPDGVAFIRLRGVQSLEGLETAIRSTLFPDGGRDKELPLHAVLAETKVLLILDNMEDPINAHPAAVHEFLLHLLQNTPSVSFLLTARQAMGGGIAGFDEKVVSLNRLSHVHAADLFLRKSPRALLLSEIGDIDPSLSTRLRSASIVEALTSHPLMAFLDGHPQAISLCAPLLQDRSLSELTRAVLSRGVSELQVVGLGANDRSAMNTLVTSLDVSLEQVRQHHGQDAIRFFALLGLLPAGAMPADFKSLWGPKWETLVETLLRFSLIQRNRIPGFILSTTRGQPKSSSAGGSTSTRRTSLSRSASSKQQATYDHALLAALKAYGDFISGSGSRSSDAMDSDTSRVHPPASASSSDRNLLNTLTRSGRVARVVDHVEKMDSQADILAVCVSYSTFPFITSYARSLLGLYDDDQQQQHQRVTNRALESLCAADRDAFLYSSARHFWKVSYWVFQHICTLAARSSASYLILDLHESNLWMLLDLHIRMLDEWRSDVSSSSSSSTTAAVAAAAMPETRPQIELSPPLAVEMDASSSASSLRIRTSRLVADVACFFAHSLFLAGRHRGARSAANKALHIAKQHKDTLSEANTRKLMGILLTTEAKFDEAKAQFGLALIQYKAVGDKLGQAASLSAIGMIHSRKGNLRGAHNCFTKALTLYEWFKHALGQLNCHQRLANLEKKLRDGDGLRGKAGAPAQVGHSHHYAATRRLQGDLNRKRNGEYIVRWVGHEMSLLLELPMPSPETLKEAHAPAPASASATAVDELARGALAIDGAQPPLNSSKPPTPTVTNSPKKCRLGQIIDQHERAAASSRASDGPAGTASNAATGTGGEGERIKASSFARRKEYAASLRRTLSAPSSELMAAASDTAPTA